MTDIRLPPLHRHESFYFFDATICLLSRGIVFRVFKSLLAAESKVFKDMFTVVSDGPAGGQTLCDGVPLISLDDDPEDLAHFFRFLWKPPRAEPEFDALCASLRISTKYVMDSISKWLQERLQAMVPYEYKDFQTCQTYYQNHPDHAAKVIALARKCHLPPYIPPAFYFLASEESGSAISVRGPYALNAEDLRRIHLGKMAIQKSWWDFVKKSDDMGLKDSMRSCYDWENASSSTIQSRMAALQAGGQDPMKHWMSKKSVYTKTCGECKKSHRDLCEEFGKKLFKELPSIFELGRKIKQIPNTARRSANRPVSLPADDEDD